MVSLLACVVFLFVVLSVGVAVTSAQSLEEICQTRKARNSALCSGYTSGQNENNADTNIIAKAVSVLSYIVGVLSVIMVMYGGFSLIIGGKSGKENSVRTGKGIITWALVGLAIAALAQIMVLFVIGKL